MWSYQIILQPPHVIFFRNNGACMQRNFENFILTPTQLMWHQQHDNTNPPDSYRKNWLAIRNELIARNLIPPFPEAVAKAIN